jgi:hypothetical protein
VQLHRHARGDDCRNQGEEYACGHVCNIRKVPRFAVWFGLFAAGLLISGFTIRRGLEPFDEGLTLQAARRVADGQVPYSDFLWAYGPAHVYLLAGLFKLFGTSLLWWRVVRMFVDAAVALVVFAIVRREAPPRWALAAWLTTALAMAQPTAANPFAPALLFALLAVLVASEGPGTRRWIGAGALVALAAAWRLDFGVYAGLAAMAAAAVARSTGAGAMVAAAKAVVTGRSVRSIPLRAAATVAAAGAALTALVYLPFVVRDGPADAWRELIGHSLREGRYWRLPFPLGYDGQLRLWPPGSLAHDAKDVLDFYVPLLLVLGLAAIVVVLAARRRRSRIRVPGDRGSDPLSPAAAGLAVLALTFVAYLLSRTDEFHSTPLIVVLAALIPLVAIRAPRPVAAALTTLLVLLFGYGALNRLSALFSPPDLSAVHVAVADGVRAPPAEARSIEAMVAAVQRRVPPGEPIYSVTRRSDLVRINDPLIYVLTERDNPTRQDFGLQTGAKAQRDIVAALVRAKPKAIVRWTNPASTVREPNARGRASGIRTLDVWLAAHYRLAERDGDYEVLVPR